jgi:hypothetical protein
MPVLPDDIRMSLVSEVAPYLYSIQENLCPDIPGTSDSNKTVNDEHLIICFMVIPFN